MLCANCEAQPVGVYSPTEDDLRVLNIVCMHALRQHLALAHRISFTSHYLEAVMKVTLDTLGRAALPTDLEIAEDVGDGVSSAHALNSTQHAAVQQVQTDAAAGSTGNGFAVSHHNEPASSVAASRASLPQRDSTAASKPYHAGGNRHVHIVDATETNGTSHLTSDTERHAQQHGHDGVDLRHSLSTWVEAARSKLGMHDDAPDRPADKTTDNRGEAESTSDAASIHRDSMMSVSQQRSSMSGTAAADPSNAQWGRGHARLESKDSMTSSVFVNIDSPHHVARKLLQDLGRMTKVLIIATQTADYCGTLCCSTCHDTVLASVSLL